MVDREFVQMLKARMELLGEQWARECKTPPCQHSQGVMLARDYVDDWVRLWEAQHG